MLFMQRGCEASDDSVSAAARAGRNTFAAAELDRFVTSSCYARDNEGIYVSAYITAPISSAT